MVSLNFMYYNLGRVHQTLRVTPAMEAGLSDQAWSVEENSGVARMTPGMLAMMFSMAGCCISILGGAVLFSSTNHNVTDGPVEWGGKVAPGVFQNQRKALTRF